MLKGVANGNSRLQYLVGVIGYDAETSTKLIRERTTKKEHRSKSQPV